MDTTYPNEKKMGKVKRDSYLRKKFEISEEEYNRQFNSQGKVCLCCGRPPQTKSLSVDHDHAVERWKIETRKDSGNWIAWPKGYSPENIPEGSSPLNFFCTGKTKGEAKLNVKRHLKRISVRGILCIHCNRGLRYYNDDPIRMEKAAKFLKEYYEYLYGDRPEHPSMKGVA